MKDINYANFSSLNFKFMYNNFSKFYFIPHLLSVELHKTILFSCKLGFPCTTKITFRYQFGTLLRADMTIFHFICDLA